MCKNNNVKLLVTGIINDSDTQFVLDALKKHQIKTLDISVDLNDLENRLPDGHPSFMADKKYAEKLTDYFLQSNFLRDI